MSKRTRTPTVNPTLAALKAAAVDADILALHLFNVAVVAAEQVGMNRRLVADAESVGAPAERVDWLKAELHASMKAALAAIDPWRAAQLDANAKAMMVVGDAMNRTTTEAR